MIDESAGRRNGRPPNFEKIKNHNMKNVLITTQHRGVWFAQVEDDADLTPKTLTNLFNCRMAIYWGTTRGLQQLCETGPTENSKISAPADIPVLHDITAVFQVTDKAAEVWLKRS